MELACRVILKQVLTEIFIHILSNHCSSPQKCLQHLLAVCLIHCLAACNFFKNLEGGGGRGGRGAGDWKMWVA